MSLSGKVAVITGGSNGIGKACVERLARDGASVVINYASDTESADALVRSIGTDRALAVQADVSTMDGLARVVDEAVARFGKIDILMANAGTMPMRNVENTTEADFDKTFALNVKGPYFLAQRAVPHMPRGARIIFVSTGLCHNSAVPPDYLLYAASKGAVEQMTRVLAKGLAATRGIIVNAVAPGPTSTEFFYRGKSEALIEGMKKAFPFGRLGEPEEVAGMVAFLAGEDSKWVNGQTYMVNGGLFV
ncbi:3-oxoacyl-[acyl-carrier-protein] reductase [Purpureocillium takamizusanense]|uniref:3-oxoacyl-[acyl-carrier-protein] reductase n=1 Tax=Purpureocillium takamizusanense TaxID=2060973 RepID=A0A9Q8Q6D4_9HYPO|nr:3-oxoacyl-[acyl-carrier-protein] reductase [Purpureocillium takamizusanense]UNI13875.1 3-oxoacyl-[acyl-carrier-protein] reductase [Purpureocillium takamizusanense]